MTLLAEEGVSTVSYLLMTKCFEFTASHRLNGIMDRSCNEVYSHDYKLAITLKPRLGIELSNGIVCDTARLKIDLAPILKRISGQYINDIAGESTHTLALRAQSSLENLTLWFNAGLDFLDRAPEFTLYSIRIYETDKFWCEVVR